MNQASSAPNDLLRAWRKTLAPGIRLTVKVDASGWRLDLLSLPQHARGQGSRVLAEFLAHADAAGEAVRLTADATDRPEDPDTLTLMRWYQAFGFEPQRPTDNGVVMHRPCQAPQPAEALLAQAQSQHGKAQRWSAERFEAWRAEWAQARHVPVPRVSRPAR